MTTEIVSRAHRLGVILRPAAQTGETNVADRHAGRHRAAPGSAMARAADWDRMDDRPAQVRADRPRTRHAAPALLPLHAPAAVRLFWVALAALLGAAVACCWDLATPDAVGAAAGVAMAPSLGLLQRLRRALRGEQHHLPGCPRAHLWGRCDVEVEVFDPADYVLVVAMRVGTLDVEIKHQGVDDHDANRIMARLAAEIVDEVGADAVGRALAAIQIRRGVDTTQREGDVL